MVLPQRAAELVAAHVRKLELEEDERGSFGACRRERLVAGREAGDAVTGTLERAHRKLSRGGVAVDN